MGKFFKKENRSKVSATDLFIDQIVDRVTGDIAEPETLAVVQAAAGIYSRCFIAAEIEPADNADLFSDLDLVIRSLVLKGESLCIESGGLLIPASSWTVTGAGFAPGSWLYDVNISTPAGTKQVKQVGADLLHFRTGCKAGTRWQGQSPIQLAKSTVDTAYTIEKAAADTGRLPIANIIGWDTHTRNEGVISRDKLAKLKHAFRNKQKTVLRTLSASANNPGAKVDALRVDPAAGLNELRRDANSDLADTLGIRGLVGDAEGTAQRESFRQFLFASIEPMARMIEKEVKAKTDLDFRFKFDALHAADLTGRGRALKQLVDSGMSLDDALETVGLA